jgi:hypothetical protein
MYAIHLSLKVEKRRLKEDVTEEQATKGYAVAW